MVALTPANGKFVKEKKVLWEEETLTGKEGKQ
jgi:hypothetical protein